MNEFKEVADEIFNTIEEHSKRKIKRVPKLDANQIRPDSYIATIIFDDYTMLEAEINVVLEDGKPALQIEGKYF